MIDWKTLTKKINQLNDRYFYGFSGGAFFIHLLREVGKSQNDVRGFTSGGLGVNLGGARYFCPLLGGRDFHDYLDYGRMGRTDGHFGHQSLLQRLVFFKKSAPTVGLFIMEYAP